MAVRWMNSRRMPSIRLRLVLALAVGRACNLGCNYWTTMPIARSSIPIVNFHCIDSVGYRQLAARPRTAEDSQHSRGRIVVGKFPPIRPELVRRLRDLRACGTKIPQPTLVIL